MCQGCTDLAEYELTVDTIIAEKLRLPLKLPAAAPIALCGHAYVTSKGLCMHCNTDLSRELAAAVATLTSTIDRQLASVAHSPSTAHPSGGMGVTIAAAEPPRPTAEVVGLSPRVIFGTSQVRTARGGAGRG